MLGLPMVPTQGQKWNSASSVLRFYCRYYEILFQDGKTFMSLPQREELAREENQFFTSKNNSGENQFFGNKNNSENQFFTHKTNSSSGGDSIHSELMTPPSDRYVAAIFPRPELINISSSHFSFIDNNKKQFKKI